MLRNESPDGGWAFVAEHDGTARLIDALGALDPEGTYTRTELSERAEVPVKTLYLDGVLEECVSLGLLEAVDAAGDGEPEYRVDPDSPVLNAAASFDAAVREARGD